MSRRLTADQQRFVESAMPVIDASIAAFRKRNANRWQIVRRCDLKGAAQQAVCLAALTYDPAKAGISAYFSVAIQRALMKEVAGRERIDRRMVSAWVVHDRPSNPTHDKMKGRAIKALAFLPPEERRLLEDHLIEGVTLGRLCREQGCHPRTLKKKILRAIEKLREAESHLP